MGNAADIGVRSELSSVATGYGLRMMAGAVATGMTLAGVGQTHDYLVIGNEPVAAGDAAGVVPQGLPGTFRYKLSGTCSANDVLYPAANGMVSATAAGRPVCIAAEAGTDGALVVARSIEANGVISTLTDVKTANYTAKYGETVLCNPTGGAFTVTLPAAYPGAPDITIKNDSASTTQITVARTGSDTIDGATSVALTTARNVRTYRAGTGAWYLVAS